MCGACQACNDCCTCATGVLPYAANPLDYLAFQGAPADDIYYGIELEVECASGYSPEKKAIDVLDNREGFLICKHDGSLRNGFELVTAPCSLDVHQQTWPVLLTRKVTQGLESWKHTTTGLHIHVSRNPLTQLTIGKIVVFMNSMANRRFLVALAGRNDVTGYAKFKTKTLDTAHIRNNDRYEVVNLQNHGTIEFRLFKGTLNIRHILADIEFVDAIVHWAIVCDVADIENWRAFMAWTMSNNTDGKYDDFVSYMAKKGYIACA